MKLKLCTALASFFLVWMANFQSNAQAQLSVSNFEMTSTSVLFDLSGKMPATAPSIASEGLIFVNPDDSESPGFALGDFLGSVSNGFTGTQQLRSELELELELFSPISTGGIEFGDYFFVVFQNPLTAGEAINGRVTANWDSLAFDPTAVSALDVYWGAEDNFTLTSGVLFDTVVVGVPEPATATAIGAVLVGIAAIRRRRSY